MSRRRETTIRMINGDGVAITGAGTGGAPVNTTRLGGAAASRPAIASFHAPPRLSQGPAPTQPEVGISPGAPAGRLAVRPTHRDVTKRVPSRSPKKV
jgi:hypothetical protein